MGGKFTPLIIIILLIAVIGVGFGIFKVINDKPQNEKGGTTPTEVAIQPEIILSKQFEEGSKKKMIISAQAKTEDAAGIQEIILPDETNVLSDFTEYTVEKNGEYEFTVIAANGQTSSAKIEITEIEESSFNNPYVPNGFEVISDSIEEGFVIEDKYGNQYVWVPVETGKLTRTTILDTKYEENNSTASALVNSVAKNYGFYIGRFEASEYEIAGKKVSASIKGKIPWTNITYTDAVEFASDAGNAFGYEDCQTALINSYAWDTALVWIDAKYTSYSSNVNYGNYDGTIYPTGTTEKDVVNNICDLAGNVREWTTEIYKQASTTKATGENIIQRVVRGGSANLSRTPGSHIGYAENTSDAYWGFRMILYK